ncbi:MAG: OB-fold nucleic acid binding domain-containing protein, partial [Planctomycetota bacterium]
MSRRYVSQLAHNEQVHDVFLATDKQLRPNRNGNLFLQVELTDRSGAMPTRMWNASERDYQAFDNGDYVMVEGATQLFQGAMQMIATSIRKARPGEVDEADFQVLESAAIDKMAGRLTEIMRGVTHPQIAALVEAYLMDDLFMGKYTRAPAGMKNHHAYTGGLLEHVVSLLELALVVAPRYPQLDQDKLLMGVFLHDSAKTDELSYDRDIAYTDAGQMLGHMTMAITTLDEKAREAERLLGEPIDP